LIKLVSHGLAISDLVGGIPNLFLLHLAASIIGQECLITGLPHLLSHMLGFLTPPPHHTHTHPTIHTRFLHSSSLYFPNMWVVRGVNIVDMSCSNMMPLHNYSFAKKMNR